jgi:hypothetical protein
MISQNAFLSLLPVEPPSVTTPPGIEIDSASARSELFKIPENGPLPTSLHCFTEHEKNAFTALLVVLSEAEGPGNPQSEQPVTNAMLARARRAFVATLAEWTQMHDFHTPFANGPPSKGQSCAKVDDEHSSKESVTCGKLFPRDTIEPGHEKILEDPRRRELYRLWIGRNCKFINNFIPLVLFATQSNVDFQPTTTKFGVIEYLTKYLTKSGQGSLLHVMEHSFSLCMERARDLDKEAGSAILRWFNLQSCADVKSQLETMHLCFGLPRFCPLENSNVWQSEAR